MENSKLYETCLVNMITSMRSYWLSCLLPALLICSGTATGAEVIAVNRGENVHLALPPLFEQNDTVVVEWEKDEDLLCKYQIKGNKLIFTYECKPQFSINTEDLGLNIEGVTSSNDGLYNCTMTRLIPPPSKDKFSLFQVKVSAGLVMQHLNSSNVTCVELLCSLEGLSPEEVNFTWTKADTKLLHHHTTNMSSTLRLCKPDWQSGDTLTCHAVYPHNHTVFSKNITLTDRNSGDGKILWLVVISVVCTCVGLFIILFLGMAVYKYRKRRTGSEAIVFNNKVYENFRFFTTKAYADPSGASHPRHKDGSRIPRGPETLGQESIYEN